jgi:hypothetical protein
MVRVPACWYRHNGLVELLSALRDHERACYTDTAAPTAAVTWMTAFRDIEARLRVWIAELRCGGDPRYHDPTVHAVTPIDTTTPDDLDVPWPNGTEVLDVERGDGGDLEAFGDGDDRRIGRAEREVRVLLDQLRRSTEVVRRQVNKGEVAGAKQPQELGLHLGPGIAFQQVARLGDHGRRHQTRTLGCGNCSDASGVVRVAAVAGGNEWAGIAECGDDHRGTRHEARGSFALLPIHST